MMEWIEFQKETLESMAPPDEDASILQEQIEENKVCHCYTTSIAVTEKVVCRQAINGRGQCQCPTFIPSSFSFKETQLYIYILCSAALFTSHDPLSVGLQSGGDREASCV